MPCPLFSAFRTVGYKKATKYWWNNWACCFGHFVYTHCLVVSLLCAYWLFLLRGQASFSFVRKRSTILFWLLIPFRIFLCNNLSSQQMIWFFSKSINATSLLAGTVISEWYYVFFFFSFSFPWFYELRDWISSNSSFFSSLSLLSLPYCNLLQQL